MALIFVYGVQIWSSNPGDYKVTNARRMAHMAILMDNCHTSSSYSCCWGLVVQCCLCVVLATRIWVLFWYKWNNNSSIMSLVVIAEERMWPGHWSEFLLYVPYGPFTLTIGW